MLNLDDAQKIKNPRVEELRDNLLFARNLKVDTTNDYLVKNWFASATISVIYGDSNCGKSFLALDIASHVAAGIDWFGFKVKKGKVLYLASEGGKGFVKRITAIRHHNNCLYEYMADNLQVLPIQVDFHETEDFPALMTSVGDQRYSLIVVDTLAMTIGSGSENDSSDMGRYIQNISHLKSNFNCHIMIIHHAGKDRNKGARGHSSLRAAVDTEIEVQVDGLMRVATTRKQRDMENGRKVAFTLQSVGLGKDEDGDPLTSCIVKPEEVLSGSLGKKQRLSGNAQIALQALQDAMSKYGHKMQDAEHYPQNRKFVTVDQWRICYLRMRAESDIKNSSIRKDFSRQVENLEKQDIVRSYDNNIWLVHQEDRQDK